MLFLISHFSEQGTQVLKEVLCVLLSGQEP